MKKNYIPNTWVNAKTHYLKAINDPWYKLLVKLQNLFSVETMKFYQSLNILTLHLPVTTGSISSPMGKGSDSYPVKIQLEGVDTYLADSMQFLLEYACRLTDKGVYYIMPSFRGEKADERHLCQFYHSEAEIRGNLEMIMEIVENYIKYLSKEVIKQLGHVIKKMIGDISHIEKVANYKGHFPRITFDDIDKRFRKEFTKDIDKYIEYNDGWRNITSAGEKKVMELYGEIVWITNYDILSVPFYQKTSEDKRTARNADLLMGIGETVGCGERHENYLELLEALKIHEVNATDYEWYINLKKYYPLHTSGFGLGTERFFMWILKCNDIRNMQLCLRFNGEDITP